MLFLSYRFILARSKCGHICKFFGDNFPKKYGPIDPDYIEKDGMELIRVRLASNFFEVDMSTYFTMKDSSR